MAEHAFWLNRVTRDDPAREFDHRFDLRAGKRAVAELMTRIDDLDPDRAAVDVARPGPIRHARVPRAAVLGHVLEDRAVLIDRIVRAHARRGIAESRDRARARFHAGVVHDQDVDRRVLWPLVEIRRERVNAFHHTPSAGLMIGISERLSTMATPNSTMAEPSTIS